MSGSRPSRPSACGRDREFAAAPGSRHSTRGPLPAKVSFRRRWRIHTVGQKRTLSAGSFLASQLAVPAAQGRGYWHGGTNVTGISALASEYAAKSLQLLKEVAPRPARVGVIGHAANPTFTIYQRELERAALSDVAVLDERAGRQWCSVPAHLQAGLESRVLGRIGIDDAPPEEETVGGALEYEDTRPLERVRVVVRSHDDVRAALALIGTGQARVRHRALNIGTAGGRRTVLRAPQDSPGRCYEGGQNSYAPEPRDAADRRRHDIGRRSAAPGRRRPRLGRQPASAASSGGSDASISAASSATPGFSFSSANSLATSHRRRDSRTLRWRCTRASISTACGA